jgi:hypothetical protein
MSWLYIRLVAHNSFGAEQQDAPLDETPSEESPLISSDHSKLRGSIHEFMAMFVFGACSAVVMLIRSETGSFTSRSS